MKNLILSFTVLSLGALVACSDEGDQGADAAADATVQQDVAPGPDARDGTVDGAPLAVDARKQDGGTTDASQQTDDGGFDGGGGDASPPTSITVNVSAAVGGEIPLRAARILALKGSVATDKALTLKVAPADAGEPRRGDIIGSVYTLEPTSEQFAGPVQLTLIAQDPIPADKAVAIEYFDPASNTWSPVQFTWNALTLTATSLISRGGRYALLSKPTAADVTCPAAGDCGGTLDGTYRYGNECSRVTSTFEPATCGPNATADVTTSAVRTGTITFSGTTFTTNTTLIKRADVRAERSCTTFAQNEGDSSCAGLASRLARSKLYTWVCSGDLDNRCFCSGRIEEPQQLSGTFFTSTGRLTLTAMADANETTENYCVAGSGVKLGNENTVTDLSKAP